MTTAELIALIKPLLERLRKYMKNKEVFDIVHQIEAHQKELEAKVIEGESEIVRLKTAHAQEIAQLKEEHAAEIAKLNEKDEKMFLHSSKRSELETQILLLLAKNSALETEQIRVATGQGVAANQYHLDEMRSAHLIKQSSGYNLETYWHLTHNGRGYLVQNGLIK